MSGRIVRLFEPEHGRAALTLRVGRLVLMLGYFRGSFQGPRAFRLTASRAVAAYAFGVLLIAELGKGRAGVSG